MKIDIETGVVDFGNGVVVDPRDTATEFERKMPRELLTRLGEPGDSIWYMADSMYVSGININIDLIIDFKDNGELRKIKFSKTTPEDMDENTYFDSRTHEKFRDEYDAILENVLKIPHPYEFSWGTVCAAFESRTPSSEIEIRYRKQTEYEKKMSMDKQENKKLSEELNQYIAALEQYKQHHPESADLQGQKMKEAEYERLIKWQQDLLEREEAKKRRKKELMEMYKTLEAQRKKEEND